MPLGDSNTEGGGSATPVAERIGYRRNLYKQLVEQGKAEGYTVDFVGSEKSGQGFQGQVDIDHAGFGGARDEDIALLLEKGEFPFYGDQNDYRGPGGGPYLDKYNPDVILLQIGTNQVDGSERAMEDVKKVLDQVDQYEARAKKEVTVIVAKIIKRVCYVDNNGTSQCPTPTEADNTIKYNNMLEAYVKQRIAAGDKLRLVDMQDGAGINYKYASDGGDMADHLHPSQNGYDKMAPVWFKELQKLLKELLPPSDTEAPETNIANKPKSLANSSTANFSFTSNESGVTYQVSIDGAPFANAANPYTVNGLADGEHTLQVRAIDAAGNIDATPATYTWTIDTIAPAVPVVSAPTEGSMLNNNKPAISGTAEAGSTISILIGNTRIGGTKAGTDGRWSFTPGTALAEGPQQLTATATDDAGNTSSASNSRRFTVDIKAPETSFASSPAAVSNRKEAEFSFSSNESGVTYEVSLDGAPFTKVSGSSFTATGLSEGEHTLTVRATDAAGNTDTTPARHTWIVDTQPPVAPTFAGVSEDHGPINNDRITSDNTIKLLGSAEGGVEVTVLMQGRVIGKAVTNSSGNWEYSHERTPLAAGTYAFTATAADAAGNVSPASQDFTVTIELTAPVVEITTASNTPTNQPIEINITFTEEVYGLDVADFSLTNARLADFESTGTSASATLVPTADGAVRVSLPAGKVTDLAGNPNAASNLLELIYDATAPTGYAVAFGVELVDVDNQSEVPLSISDAETGVTYFYSISSSNGGDPITGTAAVSTQNFTIPGLNLTALADGTLTVALYLVDEAGNRGQEVTAQVQKLTKDIVAVSSLNNITVPFKTAFNEIDLPEEVAVSYTDGDEESLKVVWSQGDYNSEVPGSYLIIGQLQLTENTSNSKNMTARVIVEVEPNQPPTALTISSDKFQPDIESEEMIGIFSTADPDDDRFTYELVSGQGDEHNNLFELRNINQLHLISNQGLSGKSTFNIRVRSTDPYENIIEQSFTLTKTLYEPDGGIRLVNAFSPDGDNINDMWVVPELRYYNSIEVQVFDRSGVRLFQTTDPEKGWDGRGRDGRVVGGSYFYIIQIKDINLVKKGVVTVLK
ncbi:Ig-like domain-containing protein [Pontibacter korlensis]|uniref:Ig-like domain-containing protein n=1 Tax=Pontibacter korlensis TaxID=400092 RepID=UPI00130EEC57|nr:Ig-like domain-containing protein [Pontibacter korlensis]